MIAKSVLFFILTLTNSFVFGACDFYNSLENYKLSKVQHRPKASVMKDYKNIFKVSSQEILQKTVETFSSSKSNALKFKQKKGDKNSDIIIFFSDRGEILSVTEDGKSIFCGSL